MDNDLVDLGSDLVVHAARLVRAVRRDLHLPAGFRVLSLLDELGPRGVSALAVADNCSQPTMTSAVGGLVGRGWVTKRPHLHDARSSVVALTPAGTAELQRVRRLHGEAVAARLADGPHSPDDLATAVAVLSDVLDPSDPERENL